MKQYLVSFYDEFDDKAKEYEINGLTWNTPVDVGFRYLVRIHFCNLGLHGERLKVLIGQVVVDANILIQLDDEYGIIEYIDYVMAAKGRKEEGKQELLISLQYNDEFVGAHQLIKGFEIFKLSNPDNNLASPNVFPSKSDSAPRIINNLTPILSQGNANTTLAIAILALVNIIVYKLREIYEGRSVTEDENIRSAKAERVCRCFSLAEIQSATKNFSERLLIGRGGFGKVYIGSIDNGRETVAIKRLKSNSTQGKHEFLTEIETLYSLKVFVEVAERCLHNEPKQRPTMAQIVVQLESALELQESGKTAEPNHVALVDNDVCPTNEHMMFFANTALSAEAAADVHVDSPPPMEQTNRNHFLDGEEDWREPKSYKGHFWALDTLWNRLKPSKRKEISLASEFGEADIRVPKYEFSKLAAATDLFSYSHEIGTGGSARVYKAALPRGRTVAVKRYSSTRDHVQWFKNEILSVSSLHHQNIIIPLGYCIHDKTLPAYTPADRILLNCGASGIFNDTSHRSWVGDTDSKFMPENATISLASYMDPSVSPVPYHTARLFTNSFTYTFPISKGQKFLRLYFYPNIYSHQDTSTSLFSVSANSFNLLTNFSAFLYSQNSSQPSFMKEFIINIKDHSVKLALTFLPEPSSTGFVNGIEIVSIPDELYLRRNEVIKYVEENSQIFNLDGNTAFESLYRLNVGGGRVDIEYDSGMNRVWYPDDNYLVSKAAGKTLHADDNVEVTSLSHTAPDIVYKSARVTANNAIILNWEFPVDSGFYYLIRLHLCEFMPGVTKSKQRTFSISLNNIAADIAADVVLWAGGPLIPTFKDYVIWAPDYSGKQNLVLSVFPVNAQDPHNRIAFLNGLEIFKLNHTNGSLASANPEPAVNHFQLIMKEKKSRGLYVVISVTVTVVVGVLAVVGVLSFLIYQRLHKVKKQSYGSVAQSSFLPPSTTSRSTTGTTAADSHPWNSCRYFPLAEIKAATSNLDRNSIIGKGGFGCVYMGVIDDGATTVAIKRLNPSSNQGAREFLTEIHMLSKLRHLHLVSLIGYCDEEGEMILVAAVDVRLDEEQHSLAGWARFCVREGQVDGLIDRNLEGQISAGCLDVFVGIAGRCIHIQPLERPSMADVVMGLELAAALQETTVVEDDDNDAEGIHSDQSQVFVSMDVICGTNCSESTVGRRNNWKMPTGSWNRPAINDRYSGMARLEDALQLQEATEAINGIQAEGAGQ
ncbi:hypothetical protein SASPL_139866 [Salvia splendens]|uniref:Protein kinase domain-containing protein n=1 Tax=Salvia splendens TaxID=180675 RepID=A0A8X8WPC0_SALSN|nr:hypothetical protein SASPL_139866 [Salvia splendens]